MHYLLYQQVAEITFNFWYKLSEVLYRKNSDEINSCFRPSIERLFEALYRHCQIDVDHVSGLGWAVLCIVMGIVWMCIVWLGIVWLCIVWLCIVWLY